MNDVALSALLVEDMHLPRKITAKEIQETDNKLKGAMKKWQKSQLSTPATQSTT
jgi:hypothetical protein